MAARSRIGFAVVGLGKIAQGSVLPAFANSKHARLVALVSSDRKKATRLARKFGAKSVYLRDEYSACLANPEVSALYIATPPGDHEHLTIQAAQAGKHGLCEKPLAATSQQSAAMVEACWKHGVLLMTAYRKYYEPSTLYLKQLIQSGKLGRIDVMHTAFSEFYSPGVSQSWLVDSKLAGGGPLMDLGVYCVNTSRWLVDENPNEVSAESWVHDAAKFEEVEEGITFSLRFPSGLVVAGSSTYGAAMSSFIFVQGTKGWASLAPLFPFDEDRHLRGMIGKREFARTFKVFDEFALEIDALATAIQNERPVEADGIEGHRDMIILEAIYESAKTQRPVNIKY